MQDFRGEVGAVNVLNLAASPLLNVKASYALPGPHPLYSAFTMGRRDRRWLPPCRADGYNVTQDTLKYASQQASYDERTTITQDKIAMEAHQTIASLARPSFYLADRRPPVNRPLLRVSVQRAGGIERCQLALDQ